MELKGMKMGVLGDSITEGVGVSDKRNMYYYRIQRACGIRELYVDGISGSRIARQTVPSANPRHDMDFISRVEKIDKDCDIVVVFGGTNDFGHGDAPLGTPEDRTEYSFWGACHVLCEKLINHLPTAQIVIMGPLHRITENRPTGDHKPEPVANLYEYTQILKTVAREYSIPFLDLMEVGGIAPKIPIQKELFMPDGLHPNDAGQGKIAARLKGFLESL